MKMDLVDYKTINKSFEDTEKLFEPIHIKMNIQKKNDENKDLVIDVVDTTDVTVTEVVEDVADVIDTEVVEDVADVVDTKVVEDVADVADDNNNDLQKDNDQVANNDIVV